MSAPKLRDLEAERGLLGAALLCERRVDQEHVLGLLPAAGYFSEAHREVHGVLSARCAEGQTWGTVELVTWAVQSSQLDRLGGLDLLTTLADRAPTTLGAERLAGVLRELWARRQVVEHADRLRELAGDTAVPWDRVDSTLTAPPQSPLAVHGGRWQSALDVAALWSNMGISLLGI
ncbi:MAG: DnaB-like helicase N-terminal domain-containing protein, partial [Ilumatobacteraceae bacterium]